MKKPFVICSPCPDSSLVMSETPHEDPIRLRKNISEETSVASGGKNISRADVLCGCHQQFKVQQKPPPSSPCNGMLNC